MITLIAILGVVLAVFAICAAIFSSSRRSRRGNFERHRSFSDSISEPLFGTEQLIQRERRSEVSQPSHHQHHHHHHDYQQPAHHHHGFHHDSGFSGSSFSGGGHHGGHH